MHTLDALRLSTRMFRTRPMRTWLTVLGVGAGAGAVLFLVSLGYGLQHIILEKLIYDQALLSLRVTPASENLTITDKTLDEIKTLPETKQVSPMAAFTGQATIGDLSGNVQLFATSSPFFTSSGISATAGSLFKDTDTTSVVVSETALKMFGINEKQAAIGKPVKLEVFVNSQNLDGTESVSTLDLPTTYTIKGVFDSGQESTIFIPIAEINSKIPIDHYDIVQVTATSIETAGKLKDTIISKGFHVSSISETIDQANKIFAIIQIILGVFGAFSLVVSSIGTFNTMTVTLLERTGEIGIMRALGGSRSDIQRVFLAESVIIGGLGGATGVCIGILGGTIFNYGINFLASKLGGPSIQLFYYPMRFLITIIGISTAIGFLSGVFPARRAAQLDPLEALRYK